MAVLDAGRNGAVRRCRRDLQEDIDLDMVASLGCMIESSFGAVVLGCCRFVDGC